MFACPAYQPIPAAPDQHCRDGDAMQLAVEGGNYEAAGKEDTQA